MVPLTGGGGPTIRAHLRRQLVGPLPAAYSSTPQSGRSSLPSIWTLLVALSDAGRLLGLRAQLVGPSLRRGRATSGRSSFRSFAIPLDVRTVRLLVAGAIGLPQSSLSSGREGPSARPASP